MVEKSADAFQAMFDTKLQYFIAPDRQGEAEVVAVICPLVSEQNNHLIFQIQEFFLAVLAGALCF